MTEVGDRVERAIERHADASVEIAGAPEPPAPKRLRRTIFWLVITGVSLYLVAPSVLDTLGSWRDIKRFAPGWLVVMLLSQGAAMASLWALQHIAIAAGSWPAVMSSQLAGN